MSRKHILYRSLFNQKQEGLSKELRLPEQLIIRVGKACNFRCVFCNVAENESVLSAKPKIKEILVQALYRIKYSNLSSGIINITISGGEPSLFQKETLFVMKYFKKYFDERNVLSTFEMQSNASNIDKMFAQRLKKEGLYDVMVSYHTHNPIEYKKYIGVDYEFFGSRVNAGIKNLLKEGISVSFNVILSNINKDSYFSHIRFLILNFPQVLVYNIGFVQPHGMAQDNYDSLFVQYQEIYKIYNKVIAYLKFHSKKVHSHLVGLPLCYIDDYSSVMEYYHNRSVILDGPSKHTLIQKINDDNKGYDIACSKCKMKGLCSGIWKEYIGIQKIKPIPYFLFPLDKDNIKVYIFNSHLNLKRIKDSGVDQIFILLDENFSEEYILNVVQKLRSFKFHLISIYCKIIPNITKFEQYYGVNFQIHSKEEKYIQFVNSVISYNNQTSGQFKIKLDIFYSSGENSIFSNYDNINIRKLYK